MTAATIVLTRQFACAPNVLFKAWTDPKVLPVWFGPEGYSCRTQAIDIREGGEWRFVMAGHGMEFQNRHRYLRIVPDQRIEFLMDAGEGSGEPKAVTVTFTANDGGTLLRQVMVFPTIAERDEALGYNADKLGQTTLEKLARAVGL